MEQKQSLWRSCTTVRPSVYSATETIGSIAVDTVNEFMATGGIARKIRMYRLCSILTPGEEDDDDEDEIAVRRKKERRILDADKSSISVICTPSRISSLQWRPSTSSVISCSDYDGVVTEWSVERGVPLVERDEHSGQRVWSVDYAKDLSDRCISASDDGTARVWQSNMEESACKISSPSMRPVCCAEFDEGETHRVALACADCNVYVYDLRRVDAPIWSLSKHRKTVSYARFLGDGKLASSSIDSSILVWDLAGTQVLESFDTHYNVRNFVGLSVHREGKLLACGSETNQVYVYRFGSGNNKLISRHSFGGSSCSSVTSSSSLSALSTRSSSGSTLVSAVCWMKSLAGESCMLAAANSEGVLQILSG